MFRTKICGITNVKDAEVAADAGADAIGLNFFPESPRFVDEQTAARIVAAVGQRLEIVGVFVNAPAGRIVELADRLPLELIQLHGTEPITRLLDLAPRKVIRAFRLRPGDEQSVIEMVDASQEMGTPVAGVLIDAYLEGSFGGTGKTVNWGIVHKINMPNRHCPLILAGGLKPENVREAIHQARCDGVDVASGVESAPGQKDPTRIRQFVELAHEALRGLAKDSCF